jgi:hypothetical protein
MMILKQLMELKVIIPPENCSLIKRCKRDLCLSDCSCFALPILLSVTKV